MTVTAAPARRWAAHIWVPSGRRGSHVDDVAEVSALMGAPLEEWQLEAVDVLTAYGRGGVPLALEGVILACRQNGKTYGVARPIAVTECLFGPPSLNVWSAQLKDTALDTFHELRDLMGRKADGIPYSEESFVPELGDYVLGVIETDSAEALLFRNGTELAFRTRSNRAGRGRRPRKLTVDEALFFTSGQASAVIPGMARQGPTAGVLYASSPALAESSYLHELVRRGRAGGDPSLAYVEHCAPGGYDDPGCATPRCDHGIDRAGCRLDDEEYWRAANPAFRTGGMSRGYLAGARRALGADFAHEHLGWHEAAAGSTSTPVPSATWAKLNRPAAIDGPPAFGIWVAYDLAHAAIAVAGASGPVTQIEIPRARDGQPDRRRGYQWVAERAEQLAAANPGARFAVLPKMLPTDLLSALEAKGVPLEQRSAAEWVADCKALEAAAKADPPRLAHHGDPILTDALAAASTRPRDDGGWIWWQLESAGDISALCAATLAHGQVAAGAVYDVLDSVL